MSRARTLFAIALVAAACGDPGSTATRSPRDAHARPNLPLQGAPPIPTSGNFIYRDEFADSVLRRDWQFLRTPRKTWHDLTTSRGSLIMRARNASIAERAQPSFIGRRQQHLHARASAAMHYRPQAAGDQAGLIAFQNDQYYFFLGVAFADGKPVIRLERHAGDSLPPDRAVIASAPWPGGVGETTYLHIEARGGAYDFSYGFSPDERVLLKGDVDGSILSTQVARGFVGTMLGLYAFSASP